MSWRPENWKERMQAIGDEILNQEDYLDRLFEAGADAMLEALKAKGCKGRLIKACTLSVFDGGNTSTTGDNRFGIVIEEDSFKTGKMTLAWQIDRVGTAIFIPDEE